MPHASLKLVGGADTQETPALNENSGISSTNLVRFFYDPNGISLVQKLGGWLRFYQYQMAAIVRALWAWEDLNLNAWLAFGTQTISGGSSAQLGVITGNALSVITPTILTDNISPQFTSHVGVASVLIQDTAAPGIGFNSVYITARSRSASHHTVYAACDQTGYQDRMPTQSIHKISSEISCRRYPAPPHRCCRSSRRLRVLIQSA